MTASRILFVLGVTLLGVAVWAQPVLPAVEGGVDKKETPDGPDKKPVAEDQDKKPPDKGKGKKPGKDKKPGDNPADKSEKMPITRLAPAKLIPDLCLLKYPVTTTSPKCQEYFDQG